MMPKKENLKLTISLTFKPLIMSYLEKLLEKQQALIESLHKRLSELEDAKEHNKKQQRQSPPSDKEIEKIVDGIL